MDKINLKPCPFCGGKAKFYEIPYHTDCYCNKKTITCTKCGITIKNANKFKLISLWNTRIPIDNTVMKLEHLIDFCKEQIEEYIKDNNEEYIRNYATELEAYKQSIKIIKEEINE